MKEEIKKKEHLKAKVNKSENTEPLESKSDFKQPKNKNEKEEEDENDKDFAYYGEEDLYYKEEKISTDEAKQIEEEIKKYRIMLIDYLNETESVQQALGRLKSKSSKINNLNINKYKPQRKKIKTEEVDFKKEGDTINHSKLNEEQIKNEKLFKELLEIISKLTELSYFNVYSDTYDKIVNKYGQHSVAQWMYRTVLTNQDGNQEISDYGPFSSAEIKSWINQVKILF